MPNEAADRNGSDVTGCRKDPRQGKTDVDERRSAQAGDITDQLTVDYDA